MSGRRLLHLLCTRLGRPRKMNCNVSNLIVIMNLIATMLVHQNMEWKLIDEYEVFAESGEQLLVIIIIHMHL